MFKRVLLSLAFVAALGAATVLTASKAAAHGGCGYDRYDYGYRAAYYPTYATSYYGYDYGPRVVAYPGAYPVYYRDGHHRGWDDDHHHHHHHGHHHDGGITLSFGF